MDLPDPLEMADEEGIDGDQVAGMAGLDMAFSGLGTRSISPSAPKV